MSTIFYHTIPESNRILVPMKTRNWDAGGRKEERKGKGLEGSGKIVLVGYSMVLYHMVHHVILWLVLYGTIL